MKRKFWLICALLALTQIAFTQVTEGEISFNVISLDTVNNVTLNLSDTVQYTYSFKVNNIKMFYGTDSVNSTVIVNSDGRYALNVSSGFKSYVFDTLPIGFKLDTLMNFTDSTSFKFYFTNEHKSILGYYSTKAYMTSIADDGSEGQTIVIWFTDQIQGNQLIPASTSNNLNVNGVILEYYIPTLTGINIVTPRSIRANSISDSIFHPDLTTYINLTQ